MKNTFVIMLVLMLLAGCQNPNQINEGWGVRGPVIVELEQVIYWLQAADDAIKLSPTQAQKRLDQFSVMRKTRYNVFRFALLNQQLDTRSGWERARDTLRELAEDKNINEDLLWIIRIHLHHNQALINNHASQQKLTRELAKSQQERLLLEEKISAITHLEQRISERKEQASEDVKANGETREK